MSGVITLCGWYQLNFKLEHPRDTVLKIDRVISGLRELDLVDMWFFLFEGDTYRPIWDNSCQTPCTKDKSHNLSA